MNQALETLILQEEEGMEDAVITGIASQKDQTKFTLHGVGDTPGIASGILSPVSDAGIEVDVIVQKCERFWKKQILLLQLETLIEPRLNQF